MISILIPHIKSRNMADLIHRLQHDRVEVIIDDSSRPLWMKRNNLYATASGQYCASVDDDDMVSADYCEVLVQGIEQGCDCLSLLGAIDFGGGVQESLHCSIEHDRYGLNKRMACHLNCIRTEIAKSVQFRPAVNIEKQWAIQIRPLLQTETEINKSIYTYNA